MNDPPSGRGAPRRGETPVELYRDAYVSLHGSPHSPLLRFTRSAARFQSIEDVKRSFGAIVEAVDRYGRHGRVMLADARAVAGRNDPHFEAVAQHLWPRIYQGLERIGVLVQTPVGRLHIERMAQDDGIVRMVGTDEEKLLDYLLDNAGFAAGRPPRR